LRIPIVKQLMHFLPVVPLPIESVFRSELAYRLLTS
jgi:hypothetical protein